MSKLSIRFSKVGLIAAGTFLSLAMGLFAWIFFVASKNPADSGESGILLLPLAMPWIMILPSDWVGPLTGLGMILLNTVILYLVFGGLPFRRAKSPDK